MAWAVGDVLQLLRELQIDNNTLVMFVSDHGPHLLLCQEGGSAGIFKGIVLMFILHHVFNYNVFENLVLSHLMYFFCFDRWKIVFLGGWVESTCHSLVARHYRWWKSL